MIKHALILAAAVLLYTGSVYLQPAYAGVTCAVTMQNVSFGAIDPTATADIHAQSVLNYTCSNPDPATVSALVCFGVGIAQTEMRNDATPDTIQYGLYLDPGHTVFWGDQANITSGTSQNEAITIGGNASYSGSFPVYGFISYYWYTGKPPGNYSTVYSPVQTYISINDVPGTTAPSQCGPETTGNFPFVVNGAVSGACQVTASGGSDINFGPVPAGSPLQSAQGNIAIRCASGTPYNLGLQPSNMDVNGTGTMTGAVQGQSLPYQLRSGPGISGPVWGNNGVSSSSAGNGVSGTGSGVTQTVPVFATLPDSNAVPDDYSDTVTVILYY